jgi:hypothetical protein
MTVQDHAASNVNVAGTNGKIDTPLTRPRSQDVLSQTYRDLMALRVKHGAGTPIGYRCSNIMELIQVPEAPRAFVNRQMADLHRLLNDPQ